MFFVCFPKTKKKGERGDPGRNKIKKKINKIKNVLTIYIHKEIKRNIYIYI